MIYGTTTPKQAQKQSDSTKLDIGFEYGTLIDPKAKLLHYVI